MDEKQHDNIDRDKLINGLKTMGVSIILMFTGPSLLYLALSNKDKSYNTILFIVAILICITAIFLFFIGIKRIINTFFRRES